MANPEVFVRIVGLRGLSADALRNFPKGRVSINSELDGVRATTGSAGIGEAGKVNELSWNTSDGLLKWSISAEDMTRIKAVQPKLKLNLMIQAASGGEPNNYGYVLLDMRDLAREISPQWFKIHGMNGAELNVSAKLNTVLHARLNPTISASEPKLLGASPEADSGPLSVAASTDSARSVLRLALSEGRDSNAALGTKVRFSLAVSLLDYASLSSLCKVAVDRDQAAAAKLTYPLPARTFWLSWTLFEKDFYTDEFTLSDEGPTRVRDTIRIECPLGALAEHLASSNPLRVYLVSQEMVLGSTDVPLPVLTPEVVDQEDPSLHQEGWAHFTPHRDFLWVDAQW